TRDPDLGKVVLYQLSYYRIFNESGAKVRLLGILSKVKGDFFIFIQKSLPYHFESRLSICL
ncbi:MAG TPA: hypothetical protein PLT01_04865, partial [Bacteroidaceae bacterium]|nr:hypothetical protein [Bacteroidaceae bacterium]